MDGRKNALADVDPTVLELIKGRRAPNGRRRRGLKKDWQQTNVRMSPDVKQRLKAAAEGLNVPVEEVVHVALARFLDGLEGQEFELKTRWATARETLL